MLNERRGVVDEAERLLKAITPGPWSVSRMYDGGQTLCMMRDWVDVGERPALAVQGPPAWIHEPGAELQIRGNAEFIAAAPDLLRALCAQVRDLQQRLLEARVVPCDSLRCVVEVERDALKARVDALEAAREKVAALIPRWQTLSQTNETVWRECAEELAAALTLPTPQPPTQEKEP